MSDKKIYMRLESEFESEKKGEKNLESKIVDELKEQPLEMVLESALKDISIKAVDGMVNIAIPEPIWQLISALLTKVLFNNLEEKQEIRR